MLFRVMIVLLAMTGFARAQAVWVDYGWAVEPAKENRFFAAVDKFTGSDAFKDFEGRMLINAHAANVTQPTNFSFAVIYEDLATFEARQAQLNGTAEWDRFRKALSANGTLVSETVYTHVKGWGEINNENFAWEGAAARVTDPANYIARLSRLMDSNIMADAPLSIDVWRVIKRSNRNEYIFSICERRDDTLRIDRFEKRRQTQLLLRYAARRVQQLQLSGRTDQRQIRAENRANLSRKIVIRRFWFRVYRSFNHITSITTTTTTLQTDDPRPLSPQSVAILHIQHSQSVRAHLSHPKRIRFFR